MGAYYFLMSLLPAMPAALGERLSVPFPELSAMARRHVRPSDEELLRAELHRIDAENWESVDQNRADFSEGGILSRQDIEARQNLPPFICEFMQEKERGIRRACIYDRLWEIYYSGTLNAAQRKSCRFLLDYVPWEIGLRNCLTALRLKGQEKNAAEYFVLPNEQCTDFSAIISQLENQPDPLSAERFLDSERLKHIYHCQGIDPFSIDALLALLLSAMIYSRWERMAGPLDVAEFLYNGG